jgi:nucleoid-associated protein YgaU
MGSFEKLVVLTVIFLASVILAVAALSDGDVQPSGDAAALVGAPSSGTATQPPPKTGGDGSAERAPAANNPFVGADRSRDAGLLSATGRATEAAASEGAGRAEDAVLDAERTDQNRSAAPVEPEPLAAHEELPELLATATGLVPSFVGSNLHFYHVGPSDHTWAGLSERFYGSAAYADVLVAENAAVGPPVPGTDIIVPSRASTPAGSTRTEPHTARAPGRTAPPQPKSTPGNEPVVEGELTGQTYRIHTVAAGESLTAIAFHYYGKASLWTRIHDANRDQLPNADRLTEGMQLRIP